MTALDIYASGVPPMFDGYVDRVELTPFPHATRYTVDVTPLDWVVYYIYEMFDNLTMPAYLSEIVHRLVIGEPIPLALWLRAQLFIYTHTSYKTSRFSHAYHAAITSQIEDLRTGFNINTAVKPYIRYSINYVTVFFRWSVTCL